ncbi:hypothetical protein niasHT_008811 [Heterodera trifolii]|uniref:Uncharacterized protein n=1 Tax=Heterodera trifolii TaxID=157864 RepID=A0ABD2LT03_9BILA
MDNTIILHLLLIFKRAQSKMPQQFVVVNKVPPQMQMNRNSNVPLSCECETDPPPVPIYSPPPPHPMFLPSPPATVGALAPQPPGGLVITSYPSTNPDGSGNNVHEERVNLAES